MEEACRVTHLDDFSEKPDQLCQFGFSRREEDTTDSVRSVWFERTFDSIESQVRFVLQVEFELAIDDDPNVSYTENLSYSFNGVFLRVIDRQMERYNNQSFDEETERPRKVGRYELRVSTVEELNQISRALGG